MIRSKPKGLCFWDFFLNGEGHHASVEFNWLGEQGAITADGILFEVRKHGLLSGHWTLEHNRERVASAQKANPFTRTFQIQHSQVSLILSAVPISIFVLHRCPCVSGSIEHVCAVVPRPLGVEIPTRTAFWSTSALTKKWGSKRPSEQQFFRLPNQRQAGQFKALASAILPDAFRVLWANRILEKHFGGLAQPWSVMAPIRRLARALGM